MNKKPLILTLVFVFGIVMFLSGCNSNKESSATGQDGKSEDSDSVKPIELKIGHTLATDSHYNEFAKKFAEVASEKSGGKIKINIFPKSQLGGEVQMIQAARAGSLGFVITAQAPLTNTIKEFAIFDLPYLFDSVDQANKVLQGDVGDKFLDMLPEYGLVGFDWLSAMERNVFSNKPIETVDDFDGFKIRVMQSPGYVKAYESLGAQPTPMAYSELYTSLQQGVIDGGDTSPDQFIMDKFIEVSDYYNLTRMHYLPALVIGSKKVWDGLSSKQQEILEESIEVAKKHAIEYYKESYTASIKKMKEEGVEVVKTDVSSLKKASQTVYDELLSNIPNGQKLFDLIEEAINK